MNASEKIGRLRRVAVGAAVLGVMMLLGPGAEAQRSGAAVRWWLEVNGHGMRYSHSVTPKGGPLLYSPPGWRCTQDPIALSTVGPNADRFESVTVTCMNTTGAEVSTATFCSASDADSSRARMIVKDALGTGCLVLSCSN
jgi:hypothetical protein